MSRALLRGLTLSILAWTLPVSAQPTYATQPGWELVLPEDPDGYSFLTAATAFPAATSRFVDGYWLAGRLLAAHGKKLFLQETFGLSDFAVVATLDANMDPSFVKVSPDGEWIAIGVGHGQPLHVAPASLLSTATPPNLSTHPAVSSFSANYYDAVFRDSRHLFINGGWGSGSGIYVLDTQAGPGAAILPLFDDIPGASAGLAFDHDGNLITGVGWGATRTGELRIVPAALIDAALAGETVISYEDDGLLLAHHVLSAAHLAVDAEGNLFVGGGDVFGSTGEFGYAALISSEVLGRVLDGGPPLDPDDDHELVRIAPDPCANDDTVSIVYVDAVEMAIVSANLASLPPNCAATDWSYGPTPVVAHFPPDAPDDDGDGIPNGMDPDHSPRQFLDQAYFSRFVDAFGATSDDPGFDPALDLDDDGAIGWGDYALVRDHWGAPRWR